MIFWNSSTNFAKFCDVILALSIWKFTLYVRKLIKLWIRMISFDCAWSWMKILIIITTICVQLIITVFFVRILLFSIFAAFFRFVIVADIAHVGYKGKNSNFFRSIHWDPFRRDIVRVRSFFRMHAFFSFFYPVTISDAQKSVSRFIIIEIFI